MLTSCHPEANDQDDKTLEIRLYKKQLKELGILSLEKKKLGLECHRARL